MISKSDILGALPKLSRGDLEAVHAMASHLLGATAAPATAGGTLGGAVFDALVAALGASMAYSRYSPTASRQFEKKLPDLTKFLDQHFEGWNQNKVSQLAFLKMLFSLLADDLKERGVAPTIGIMVTNIPRLSEVFNNAFPGYLANGLGSMILKNFQQVAHG